MTTLEIIQEKRAHKLPPGWRWVQFKDVVHINPRRPANLERSDDTPTSFVPMEAIDEVTGTIAKRMTRPFREIKQGYTHFAEGDVLFAKITPCMQNGKHAIARDLKTGIGFGTTEFHVLRPGPHVIAEWIHYFVRQRALLLEATEYFTGSVGQQRLPADYLAKLYLPLPPLDEQKRIAAILKEQLTAIERARQAAEARLEVASCLLNAFVESALNGDEAKVWPRMVLLELCTGPGQYGTSQKSNGNSRGLPVLGMYHIHDGRIRWEKVQHVDLPEGEAEKYLLEPGDLLFNRTNSAELVGKTAVYELKEKAVFASYIIRFRLDREKADPYFISTYINSCEGRAFIERNMTRAIGQVNISASTMHKMPVPAPKLATQKRIGRMLRKRQYQLDKLKVGLKAEAEAIEAMPTAILRQAFAGEL